MDNEIPFDCLKLDQMIERIVACLEISSSEMSPFALLLGAGFSWPIIPTAREMVRNRIAQWIYQQISQNDEDFVSFEEFEKLLWSDIQKDCPFIGDGNLPETASGWDHADAETISKSYQAVMSASAARGLSTPAMRRDYLRSVIKETQSQINPAHLYLASILQSQDLNGNEIWRFKSSFCRTVFTTNFDPLLQRSLQLVNKLYYMSDRPEKFETPSDDSSDAIHLVYTHGSVHRYRLLNTEEEIDDARARNAPQLVQYFERHGVIVIGYSGWPDTTMDALRQCSIFDNNLYWCGLKEPRQAAKTLPDHVIDLLRNNRGNAFYIPIHDADAAMKKLHKKFLDRKVPRFVTNPLPSLIEQLKNVASSDGPHKTADPERQDSLTTILQRTIDWLEDIPKKLEANKLSTDTIEVALGKAINECYAAFANGDYPAAIQGWTKLMDIQNITDHQQAIALLNRGNAHWEESKNTGEQEHEDLAFADYSQMIKNRETPPIQKIEARLERGSKRLLGGESAKAMKDFNAVLASTSALPPQKVRALIQLGKYFREQNKWDKSINTLEKAIETEDALPHQCVQAQIQLGLTYEKRDQPGDLEKAFDYFCSVQNMPEAQPHQRATALIRRGIHYRKRKQWPKAMRDFNSVIEKSGAEPHQRVNARIELGITLEEQGQHILAIREYDYIIEFLDPRPQLLSRTTFRRGTAYRDLKEWASSIRDFTEVAESGFTADQRDRACFQRGVTYEKMRDKANAIKDYRALVDATSTIPDVRKQAEQRLNRLEK